MRRAPSGGDMNASTHPEDNASVASDMTYQSEMGWGTMLGYFHIFILHCAYSDILFRLGRTGDATLDDMLKNLYQDPV